MHDCQVRSRSQRGISLLGLMFWVILVGFTALVAIKTFPSVNEFLTIKRSIGQIANSGVTTVQEVRAAFEKQKEIEYSIKSLSGKDLEITKENDKIVIAFKYDSEVQLYGPVSLLIHYEGRSN
jgi:hypothetical protein